MIFGLDQLKFGPIGLLSKKINFVGNFRWNSMKFRLVWILDTHSDEPVSSVRLGMDPNYFLRFRHSLRSVVLNL